MPKFEVEFYEKDNGEQPAKEFLLSLDVKMRAKMVNTIAILSDNGYELRELIQNICRKVYLNYGRRSVRI